MDWDKILKDAVSQLPGWLLTTTLGFLGGFLFRWFSERSLRTLPSRVLLGLKNPAKAHIVLGIPWGIIPDTTKLHSSEGMPIFGYGPLHAYHYLTELITTAYRKVKNVSFTTSKTFSIEGLSEDLILIGYPQGNEITKQVMNDLKPPLIFDGHTLIETATGNVKYKATVENGRVIQDYGCIIRAPNPYSSDSTIIILAGCETFGVKAAAEFFKPKNLRLLRHVSRFYIILLIIFGRIVPKASENEYYQVVVSTQVRGLFTSEPCLVEHFGLSGKINSGKKI